MRGKKSRRVTSIQVRCTVKDKNLIRNLANLYADGSVSGWILYSALNAPRKFIASNNSKKRS